LRRPAPGKVDHDDDDDCGTSRTACDDDLRSDELVQRRLTSDAVPERGRRNAANEHGRSSSTWNSVWNAPAERETRRGARRNDGNDVGRSSGSGAAAEEEEQQAPPPPVTARRPQSAWNSRTGRRPQFTFSDVHDRTDDVDETRRTSDATRRDWTSGVDYSDTDSDSDVTTMTSVKTTAVTVTLTSR